MATVVDLLWIVLVAVLAALAFFAGFAFVGARDRRPSLLTRLPVRERTARLPARR